MASGMQSIEAHHPKFSVKADPFSHISQYRHALWIPLILPEIHRQTEDWRRCSCQYPVYARNPTY